MDSPRVSTSEGETLFLEQGGNSEYLQRISSILEAIYHGQQQTNEFVELMLKYDLIESFTLKVELNDGTQNQLQGFYIINEDKQMGSLLNVCEIMSSGYLQAAYMVIASMSNFRSLIDRKNDNMITVDKPIKEVTCTTGACA